MPRKNWHQVKEVFHDALRHDSDERGRYLDQACGDDVEFRIEVESLLISLADAKSFLEDPVIGEMTSPQNGWRLADGQSISHYKIVSPIASGGMGEVYLAKDESLHRNVALKILPQHMLAHKDRLRRFQREAELVSALNHPNIVTIFEFGLHDDVHYISCEFVEGETLRERLDRGPVPVQEALDVATQIASALNAAHTAGVIHRDIKPENVMIRVDGYVKVLDFGLAKLADATSGESADTMQVLSRPGLIMGTVKYMSPEQTRGLWIDERSDIFSFGVVLYEMLAGTSPFAGETTTDILAAVIQSDPPAISSLIKDTPPEVDRILDRALEKDRTERYQTAADLLSDLKRAKKHAERSGEFALMSVSGLSLPDEPQQAAREASTLTGGSSRSSGQKVMYLIAAILLATAGLGYWNFYSASDTTIGSIAVMPFVNESGNPEFEYLSDGMTETLINQLSQLPNLNVKARSSVFQYKSSGLNPQEIGRKLSVQAVLNGRVIQQGNSLTVSWSLMDVGTGDQIWGERYERTQADLVSLQSEIARDILEKLRSKISVPEKETVVKKDTEDPEAYRLYLKGRHHLLKVNRRDIQIASDYFQQAINTDPVYAKAYVGLADAYRASALGGELPSSTFLPKAKAAAQKAVEIDDQLADAHAMLGLITFWYDWDWEAAEAHYKRSLALDSKNADAHLFYAHLMSNTGRHDEALSEARTALDLDPVNLRISGVVGQFFIHAGRSDEAIEQLKRALELDNHSWFIRMFLSSAYIEMQMYPEAISEARASYENSGGSRQSAALMIYALAKSGQRSSADSELHKMLDSAKVRYLPPYSVALAYNGLGRKAETIEWLERGYQERDLKMTFLKVEPKWNNLRSDPEFQSIMRRVGFKD